MNTSCGVLLLSPSGRLLPDHASHARHRDIPKGMAEPGETPRETAVREALEETSLRRDADSLVDLGSFALRPAKRGPPSMASRKPPALDLAQPGETRSGLA